MTWNPRSEELWKSLEGRPSKMGVYYVREIVPGSEGAFLARDSVTGARHLLLRVTNPSGVRQDKTSRGVKLEVRSLEGDDGGNFADFWCADPSKEKLFGVMVDEVLDRWRASEGSGPAIAFRVLQAWRTLLASEQSRSLSVPEQAGLLGELLFLEALNENSEDSVNMWRGPDGAAHDFWAKTWTAEVKTSLNRKSIFIHGANQLELANNLPLILTVFEMSLGPSGICLSDQIRKVRAITGGPELERKLLAAGFRDQDAPIYHDSCFQISNVSCYQVEDGFPRITYSGSLREFNPAAFGELNYELLLAAISQFSVNNVTLADFPNLKSD